MQRQRRPGALMSPRKRMCRFCEQGEVYIDYKDEKRLQRFVTELCR